MLSSQVHFNLNEAMPLENINILGVENKPNQVKLNNISVSFEYISSSRRIIVGNINDFDLGKPLRVSWN
jgi:hypothetical protein